MVGRDTGKGSFRNNAVNNRLVCQDEARNKSTTERKGKASIED